VYVEEILKMGLSFCSFDFSGCGNSEGSSISFGANEKFDIGAVVEKVKEMFGVTRVILWGRSMGSACAVKYCQMLERSPVFEER
jgi:alpha-beta hydrolase superfamily lysophospholipase